jgi:hypothetical protein
MTASRRGSAGCDDLGRRRSGDVVGDPVGRSVFGRSSVDFPSFSCRVYVADMQPACSLCAAHAPCGPRLRTR